MSFDIESGISGAMAGAKLGPWGALGGGLLGGFMGGNDVEPEYYTADMYARDMAPYKDMIDKQYSTGGSLMNRQSNINRLMNQQTMQNSMDQMGTANLLSSRNMAEQGGGAGANSGLLQQMLTNSFQNYGQQGLQQADQNYINMFQKGLDVQSGAMSHMGDYSAGLAELNAGNIGTQNAYAMHGQQQRQEMLGGLLGEGMAGIEGLEKTITTGMDANNNPITSTLKGLDVVKSWF
jgi:hypothetical protein